MKVTGGNQMREWIIIIALYALGVGLFQLLGGLGTAAEALKRWGAGHSSIVHCTNLNP
jgi:hypothetical protein